MRVSTQQTYNRISNGLGTSLLQVQRLQEQVATGQRINKLSDDPVGAAAGWRLRGEETDWSAYQRSADDALAILGTADAGLQRASNLILRAQELTVAAGNGAYSKAELSALADEVRQVRDQMVDTVNTQHMGRAIFGGHRSVAWETGRKDAGGSALPEAWVANTDAKVSRQVSPAVTVEIGLDGAAVFGSGGANIFSVLESLENAMRNPGSTPTLAQAQVALQGNFERVTSELGKVGAMTNRVTAASELGQRVLDQVKSHRSRVEDVDLAEAITRLNGASAGYQAALAAAARANLPSLANFLS